VYSLNNSPIFELQKSFVIAAGIINVVSMAFVLSLFAVAYSHFIGENIFVLEEAENKQRELNTQKNRFFTIFSHDLKNPVSSIHGFVDLLIDRYDVLDHEHRKKYLLRIQDAVKETYKLVNSLLEWSKSQIYNAEVFPRIIFIEQAVSDIKCLFEQAAKSKNISILLSLDNKLTIYADEHMFLAIMRNLVSNAIKFTNKDGKIIISAKANKKTTMITVSDTGIGIPNEDMQDIFKISDKKIRLGTENEHGTGLGLNVAKEFVEKNNGSIHVESEIGKGTKFVFFLPSTKN
jgi:signal transduction histidine kinase